ncbi:histidinol-phosphatase HisJ [Salisediminibacterium beveridgei]|uniref:Histidinol-phosphatase n=1 Tax=Salisediminibacterium beveridgei TaxID=632773 RepID=A0A1D7QT96_9BACI|nr:histidinol-phosphatase HisJ [Salisediminibacterium beveridgei]AOM82231.1 Histidinol-phosphatase [Salisediminibacterium beveridgei]
MQRKDGHIHSPYCPHGSSDNMEKYVQEAIHQGFEAITFTEHAPLPEGFTDPVPDKDSAMAKDDLSRYFKTLEMLKKAYQDHITIHSGLELDFIEGFEHEIQTFIDAHGHQLDELILSVHFLKLPDGSFICLDFDEASFAAGIEATGSLQSLYRLYYQTVLQSVKNNLHFPCPVSIGHISLVHKFQSHFQRTFSDEDQIRDVLFAIKEKGFRLDVNGAGLVKPLCKETYPPPFAISLAQEKDIPLVYGSDAHSASGIGQGYATIKPLLEGKKG